MHEHRNIERVIYALVAFSEQEPIQDKSELRRYVTFLARFADERHHHKEEEILFRTMVEAGFPQRAGPVGMMLMEHEVGRSLIATLRALADQETWSETDVLRLREAAARYANLMLGHIRKEDGVLYPMARQHLAAEAIERVARECEQVDRHWEESGETARLLALVP
jgi:hemerythrin-like domain-containing protein